jgi:hypothetical protein
VGGDFRIEAKDLLPKCDPRAARLRRSPQPYVLFRGPFFSPAASLISRAPG